MNGPPERIWLYGGLKYGRMIAYTNPARWVGSLRSTSSYTEYVRADLPRATAADIERKRIIAMADALEYELPNYEQMKGVEALRKKLQAEPPRATGETTVEGCLAELREIFPRHYCSVSHEGRLVLGMGWKLEKIETVARIRITSATVKDTMLPIEADADSLNEAMAQVREWASKQVRATRTREPEGASSED